MDSKQWKKHKVTKEKKMYEMEQLGGFIFFFLSENMHVDVCIRAAK